MIKTIINWPNVCIETSSKSTIQSVTTAYGFATFMQTPLYYKGVWRKVISYSTNNDKHDFMINWPYFSIEISSKSTVTASLKKWDHCVWICHFSADPLIAHSLINMTMIIWSTNHIFLMKYYQNPQYPLASKSVTTAYGFGTFLQTPYSTLNDEYDNDYMINWP